MENEFKSASYQEVGKGWSLKNPYHGRDWPSSCSSIALCSAGMLVLSVPVLIIHCAHHDGWCGCGTDCED